MARTEQKQKMMLFNCYSQYASKFGKLSSGQKTEKCQFSFQSARKVMPKNVQTTVQLHSFHMLAKMKMKMKVAQLYPTLFSRPQYWSGQLFPPPGDLPDPGIEPGSPALQADSLPPEPPGRANCRLEALLISKRLLTVPCHVGFSTGPLRTQQLTSAKAARETENQREWNLT